ncbi:hypothetical protein BLA29_002486 [Euroglyphus maynei]|uniref:Uncharacterized protein n=1 Tax=Euroglyphus maynei TaxID=6958 RepID=A0A1Y3AV99_EURMA|nr:hypothetical protein BLA29_002486 [Euroglyphus maynei]
MDTDNDETDQSSSLIGKEEEEENNDEKIIKVKKPLRKTKRKRRLIIEDISSPSTELNYRPITRSQAAASYKLLTNE